jgi:hypothetical protein
MEHGILARGAAAFVVALLVVSAPPVLAAQDDAQHQQDVTAAQIEAARARLSTGGTLAEKVARAQARSSDLEGVARERAARFAETSAGQSAAQLRAALPGNAAVARVEAKPCADPLPNPPADAPGFCAPGER